jgi:hypothetical protein
MSLWVNTKAQDLCGLGWRAAASSMNERVQRSDGRQMIDLCVFDVLFALNRKAEFKPTFEFWLSNWNNLRRPLRALGVCTDMPSFFEHFTLSVYRNR